MKLHQATATTSVITLAAIAGNHLVWADKHQMDVIHDGTAFDITYFDDGRSRPYTVQFSSDEVGYTFVFLRDGAFHTVGAGSEVYTVSHHVNAIGSGASHASRTKHEFLHGVDYDDHHTEVIHVGDQGKHGRLFACEDCQAVWNVLCEMRPDTGVGSVCAHGDLSEEGRMGTVIMCETFVDACEEITAEAACDGQCVPGSAAQGLGGDHERHPATNPLLSSRSLEMMPSYATPRYEGMFDPTLPKPLEGPSGGTSKMSLTPSPTTSSPTTSPTSSPTTPSLTTSPTSSPTTPSLTTSPTSSPTIPTPIPDEDDADDDKDEDEDED